MKKQLIILLAIGFLTSNGQTDASNLLNKADSNYFDYKNFDKSLELYKKAKQLLTPKNKDYEYTVDKIARSIFYLENSKRDKKEYEKSISLSNEYIDLVEKEGDLLDPSLVSKKYFMYKNIIADYFALNNKAKAKPYQDLLYKAYKEQKLPDGINKSYNFEKIEFNGLNVWGYEFYPQLGDEETKGSFSKHIYYVYSTNEKGEDKEELYTLQTVKVHKFKNDEPDFVLTKRKYLDKGEKSETIWSYTFNNPVDYEKLHNAIIEFLKGNVKTDTESEVEYGKGGKVKIK